MSALAPKTEGITNYEAASPIVYKVDLPGICDSAGVSSAGVRERSYEEVDGMRPVASTEGVWVCPPWCVDSMRAVPPVLFCCKDERGRNCAVTSAGRYASSNDAVV